MFLLAVATLFWFQIVVDSELDFAEKRPALGALMLGWFLLAGSLATRVFVGT